MKLLYTRAYLDLVLLALFNLSFGCVVSMDTKIRIFSFLYFVRFDIKMLSLEYKNPKDVDKNKINFEDITNS